MSISNIRDYWNNEAPPIVADFKASERAYTESQKKMDEQNSIEYTKNNPFSLLKAIFIAVAKGGIKTLITHKKISQEFNEKRANLLACSSSHADSLVLSTANTSPEIREKLDEINTILNPIENTRNTFLEIKEKTQDILNVISNARKEVSEALGGELLDMVASNPLSSLSSHWETEEAVEWLKNVGAKLEDYATFIKEKEIKLSSSQSSEFDIDGIQKIATWDLWTGLLDIDLISVFTSYKNHSQLSDAANILDELKKSIEPTIEKINESLLNIQDEYDQKFAPYASLRDEVLADMNFPQIFYDSIPAPEDRIPRQPEIAQISTMGIAPG